MEKNDFLELKNFDSEDIDDVLVKIEKSYGFKFEKHELINVKTFGELCDIIVKKLNRANVPDCTTQQAFYKLRNAIYGMRYVGEISPATELDKIFPRQSRRYEIKQVEALLGFSLNLLHPKSWVTSALIYMLLISIVVIFFKWQPGLCGIMVSIFGFNISNKLGKEFELKTAGQVAKKMSREYYLRSRRKPATVNRIEVEEKIRDLFAHDLDLNYSALTREAKFV